MSKLTHVLGELGRNVVRHPLASVASLLSLALLLLLFDLFWIAAQTSNRFYQDLLSEVEMELFVSESLSDSAATGIQRDLEIYPEIASVRYLSKDDARRELESLVGVDLLVGYDTINPLPRSYLLSFTPAVLSTHVLDSLQTALVTDDRIDAVEYGREWLAKAESTRNLIRDVGIGLGALILLAALINATNSLRLLARTRAEGITQMLLLGSGRLFVAAPFILEGMLIGGVSAAVGWLAIRFAASRVDITQVEIIMPTVEQIVGYCLVLAFLGGLAGWLGVSKFLRYSR